MPTTQSKALVTNRLIIQHVMTGGTAHARNPPERNSTSLSAVAWRDVYKFATALGRHLEADDNLGNLRFCDVSILDAYAKSYNEDKHRYTLTALAKIRIIGPLRVYLLSEAAPPLPRVPRSAPVVAAPLAEAAGSVPEAAELAAGVAVAAGSAVEGVGSAEPAAVFVVALAGGADSVVEEKEEDVVRLAAGRSSFVVLLMLWIGGETMCCYWQEREGVCVSRRGSVGGSVEHRF
jgi:hypothetical protein